MFYQDILTAVFAFIGTNLDDIVLLGVLFMRENKANHKIIAAGQLSGIWILTQISVCAAFGLQLFSPEIVHYSGVIPIVLGVMYFLKTTPENTQKPLLSFWSMTGLTVANGSDNIGVYTALFSIRPPSFRITATIVFTIMTVLLCYLGYLAGKCPKLKSFISRHCRLIVPAVLIAIGLKILFS